LNKVLVVFKMLGPGRSSSSSAAMRRTRSTRPKGYTRDGGVRYGYYWVGSGTGQKHVSVIQALESNRNFTKAAGWRYLEKLVYTGDAAG
jgi:hypothetical protein